MTNRWEWERALRAARDLSSTEKLVALTLATYADGAGEGAHPGEQLLAEGAGLSDRAVRAALGRLRDAGWVERIRARQGRRARSDEYVLTRPDRLSQPPLPVDNPPEHRQDVPAFGAGTPEPDDANTGTSRPEYRNQVPPTRTGPEQEQTTVVPLVRSGPGGRSVDNPRRRSTGAVASSERGPPAYAEPVRTPTHPREETRCRPTSCRQRSTAS